ncbi:MAG: hypothetical protein KKA19_01885 [Candidatus Margulisbacteria bacterium]|nr:hypothetical protein [Candidatus Margulisiibacteriota bacterium]
MSYRKIISSSKNNVQAKLALRLWLNELYDKKSPIKEPIEGIVQTNSNGALNFCISGKTINFYCSKGSQAIKYKLINTEAYGWVLRLSELKSNIFNDYQLYPEITCFRKGYEYQTVLEYLNGKDINPVAGSVYTGTTGTFIIYIKNKSYTLDIKKKAIEKIKFTPIKTTAYGWVIRFTDSYDNFLSDFYLTNEIQRLFRGYEIQSIIDLIEGKNIEPEPFIYKTDSVARLYLYVNEKPLVLSTGLKKGYQKINIIPIKTNAYGWILRLADLKNNFLKDYQLFPNFKLLVHGYELELVKDFLAGKNVELQAGKTTVGGNGIFVLAINNKIIIFSTGTIKNKTVCFTPLKTEPYDWILRLSDLQGKLICDYQLIPKTNEIRLLNRGYKLNTIIDYWAGKDIKPLEALVQTDCNGVLHFQINRKSFHVYTDWKKSHLVSLVPKYSNNYGWLIEVWDKDKTTLFRTIDRRRL